MADPVDVLAAFLAMSSTLARSPQTGPRLSAAHQARIHALFAGHYELVWRVLRRCGLEAAQADDGAQQVFLVALQRLGDLKDGAERSFLCATALKIAVRLRQGQPREELPGELPEQSGGALPDEQTEQRRMRALLDSLLFRLDPDLRAVLVLQEIEGLSKRETAQALGVPEGTVASRLRRARETLEALVAEHVEREAR